jgi:putative membrane protein
MVDDHVKANRQLKSIAQKSSIPLPGKTDAEHNKTRADLEKLNGPQFDRALISPTKRSNIRKWRSFSRGR